MSDLNFEAEFEERMKSGHEISIPIEIDQEGKWVKRARPSIVFAVLIIIIIQYAILPLVSQFTKHPFEYMPEFAVVAVLAPVIAYVISRTIEKIKGVA